MIYGIGLVMVGLLVYSFNLFGKKSKEEPQHWSDLYNLILSTVGIGFISYFLYDICYYFAWLRDHTSKEKHGVEFKLMNSDEEFVYICRPLEIIGKVLF